MRDLILPAGKSAMKMLRTGDKVLLSGFVATVRDAAHRLIMDGAEVPFDLRRIPVFYAGPAPAPPGRPCGSCGPTTSARMEPFIPAMLEMGMRMVIGKGDMSHDTRELFSSRGAIYLAAAGGAGALCATRIKTRRIIAWEHLGPEAISLLELDRLPVFVAWDLHGGNIFDVNRRQE